MLSTDRFALRGWPKDAPHATLIANYQAGLRWSVWEGGPRSGPNGLLNDGDVLGDATTREAPSWSLLLRCRPYIFLRIGILHSQATGQDPIGRKDEWPAGSQRDPYGPGRDPANLNVNKHYLFLDVFPFKTRSGKIHPLGHVLKTCTCLLQFYLRTVDNGANA